MVDKSTYNIIFTRPSYKARIGGVTSYLRQLLMNIDTKTFNVIDREKYLRNLSQPIIATTFDRIRIKTSVIIYFCMFPFKLVSNHVDIVHANPSLNMNSLIRDGCFILIAKLFNKKTVVFFHGWNDNTAKIIMQNYLLRGTFCKVFNTSNTIFVLANEFKIKLQNIGIHKPIIVETTNVDESLLGNFVGNKKLRKNWDGEEFRILFLSRITRAKGVYRTVEIFRLLRERYSGMRLIIAGDGPDLVRVREYVRGLEIPDVQFLGFVSGEKKKEAFERSDIYLFPTSHGEGMPISVLEAMAFGLPIITRPVGGIKDFFVNGMHGFMTESKSVSVFADLVRDLATDENLFNKICLYNYSFARDNFMGSKVTLRVQAVYSGLFKANDSIRDWYVQ